jgi:hypothetical protein
MKIIQSFKEQGYCFHLISIKGETKLFCCGVLFETTELENLFIFITSKLN